jgi:hypothetical protein
VLGIAIVAELVMVAGADPLIMIIDGASSMPDAAHRDKARPRAIG